jgi:hypothetical protein
VEEEELVSGREGKGDRERERERERELFFLHFE